MNNIDNDGFAEIRKNDAQDLLELERLQKDEFEKIKSENENVNFYLFKELRAAKLHIKSLEDLIYDLQR